MSNSTQEESDVPHPSQAVLKVRDLHKAFPLVAEYERHPRYALQLSVRLPGNLAGGSRKCGIGQGPTTSAGFVADSHGCVEEEMMTRVG